MKPITPTTRSSRSFPLVEFHYQPSQTWDGGIPQADWEFWGCDSAVKRKSLNK